MLLFNESFNISYFKALQISELISELTSTRNGDAKVLGQATFIISPNDPRLCFLRGRKLNYKFAFVESAWILEGRNDLKTLLKYISSYNLYSDDDQTLNGAYGYRLRHYFKEDQVENAINHLKNNPDSRRVVLQIYAPDDLNKDSKDIPCNTTIYLKIENNHLNITVINRSNDLFLGIPYNIFVFGILQKYIANRLNINVGVQTQITDNLHVYEKDLNKVKEIITLNNIPDIKKNELIYNWNYSNSIINNKKALLNDLKDIDDPCLRAIMINNKESLTSTGSTFLKFIHEQTYDKVDENLVETKSKMSKFYDWQKLSMASSFELEDFIEANKLQLHTIKDKLRSVINQNNSFLTLKDDLNDDVFIASIILSSAWYSLDPLIINSPLGSLIKGNYQKVCNSYGLSIESLNIALGSESIKEIIQESLI